MTDISRRLEQFISSAQKNLAQKHQLLPIKTEEGILVGDVLIVSDHNLKHIKKNDKILFKDVFLNAVAVKLANISYKNTNSIKAQELYNVDQEYGKWFIDSQLLRKQYQKSIEKKDYEKADFLYSRYCQSRDRAEVLKNKARTLAQL